MMEKADRKEGWGTGRPVGQVTLQAMKAKGKKYTAARMK